MNALDHESEIRRIWQVYCRAVKDLDVDLLASLWEPDFAHLVFQAEEFPRASRTWDEIAEYWASLPSIVDHFTEWNELETDVAVIGDAALLYGIVQTGFKLRHSGELLSGEVRFTVGLRNGPDGWRFVHFHESRQLVI